MSKWQKISPDQIKYGDFVRWDVGGISTRGLCTSTVANGMLEIGQEVVPAGTYPGTWYIRKPRKYKPPTRPDEPPVGSFFKNTRTGISYQRCDDDGDYRYLTLDTTGDIKAWDEITEPGDTITRLSLVEATE